MARNTKIVTIDASNRDNGRSYLITEASAVQAERWAQRALYALTKANPDVPEKFAAHDVSAVTTLATRTIGSLAWEDVEPLLDEMMGCVQAQPASGIPRKLLDDDIEEVSTRLRLRAEIIELHTGFSIVAGLSELGAAFRKVIGTTASAQAA